MLMNRTEVGHAGVACHTRLVSCRVAASSNKSLQVTFDPLAIFCCRKNRHRLKRT
jgi:hypothetical protein